MKMLFRTPLNLSYEEVKAGFNRELFEFLAPQWAAFNLERFDGCKVNDEVHIELNLLGMKKKWVSLITHEGEDSSGWSFIDEGKVLPWPLAKWKHHHRVDKISDSRSEIVDDIEFEVRNPALGKLIYPVLWSSFAIRPDLYKKYFEGK